MSLPRRNGSFLGQRISSIALMSTMLTLGILSFGTSAKAQKGVAAIRHGGCTNATLNSDYGAQITGYRLPGPVPFASLGLREFDGKGNYKGNSTNNLNGTYSSITAEGTYQVNQDCTLNIDYTVTNPDGSTRKTSQTGVIVNEGQEILVIQTSPPNDNVESGVYKKVTR